MEAETAPRYKTALLVVSAVILLWGVLGAVDVRNLTYTGYYTDGNNTVIQVRAGSPADAAGLEIGDLIRSIDGISVTDTRAQARRARPTAGEVRAFEVERDGETLNLELRYAESPVNQRLTTYGGILIGVCFLVFGVWAYLTAPGRATALLAVLGLTFGPAFTIGPYFASAALRTAVGAITFAVILVGLAVLLHFLLVFPRAKQLLQRRNMMWVIYGPAAVVALVAVWVTALQSTATSESNAILRLLFGLFEAAYFVIALIALIHSYVVASSQDRAAQGLNLLLVGSVAALGPLLLLVVVSLLAPQVVLPGAQYFFLTLVLIPVTFALAAVKVGRAAAAVA
jgi:hypothetical protein